MKVDSKVATEETTPATVKGPSVSILPRSQSSQSYHYKYDATQAVTLDGVFLQRLRAAEQLVVSY